MINPASGKSKPPMPIFSSDVNCISSMQTIPAARRTKANKRSLIVFIFSSSSQCLCYSQFPYEQYSACGKEVKTLAVSRTHASAAEHDLCAKQTVLIGDCTHPTGFFCDMADGLDTNTVSFSLGGQKHPAFFPDNSIIRVFNLNQYQTVAMQISCIRICSNS